IAKRGAPTRHSRFGTTITLKANKELYVLHRQEAITADPSEIIDGVKKQRAKKAVRVNEVGVFNSLSSDALGALAMFASKFVESCFNSKCIVSAVSQADLINWVAFMSCVLKDIKAERPRYTEKDNLRLLFLTKWFLEFFLLVRENQEKERKQQGLFAAILEAWPFGYVSEVVEHGWAPWVLRRMRAAVEEKLNLIVLMAQDPDEVTQEAAETLQHQLYYNGEALDVALESLRNYKDQSIAFLDSAVHLAYVLLRMLEKWAQSQGEMYVRKKKKKSRAKKGRLSMLSAHIQEGIVDVESDEDDEKAAKDLVKEQMFVFDKYEAKFAQEDIAHACLVYLSRWREFTSSEQMRRVVSLLHRQAIKAKAEGFFFKVSTLMLFQSILKNQSSLPKDQPYKDLIQLINFILRKFFKNAQEHPLLLVEAFYPKNRGQWKAYSSYEPEVKPKSKPAGTAEVGVKKGFKTSEQIGIAVACLVEEDSRLLIDWVIDILKRVGRQRRAIVEETDAVEDPPSDEDEEAAAVRQATLQKKVPSAEAMDKFEEYRIPYLDDQQSEAATSNKYLKLLMRLVGFTCTDDDALELEWHVPKQLTPSELQTSQNVIEQYLSNPIDLQGKKAKDHLTAKRTTRRKRNEYDASSPSSEESKGLSESGEEDFLPNDEASVQKRAARRAAREERRATKRQRREERESKKRERKKKEVQVYKSAETIEDSDAELGDDDAFFAKERELMEKANQAGQGTYASATMLQHGTKKRKNKEGGKKRRGKRAVDTPEVDARSEEDDDQNDSLPEDAQPVTKPKPRPRPRPKPKQPSPPASPKSVVEDGAVPSDEAEEEPAVRPKPRPRPRPKIPVESDEE
ncbi:unnamed protein product, partial [Rhizoctonia solani]